MITLAGITFSYLDLSLLLVIVTLALSVVLAFRRISVLEARLVSVQRTASRDIKMVNQGAIGIGRRFAAIEKHLKKPTNVARFEAAKEKAPNLEPSTPVTPEPKPAAVAEPPKAQVPAMSTQAEQALSAWITEHKTA